MADRLLKVGDLVKATDQEKYQGTGKVTYCNVIEKGVPSYTVKFGRGGATTEVELSETELKKYL